MYRLALTALEVANSYSARQKSGTYTGGVVDIPFPRPIRDALLAEGLAQQHHWVADSGWITFHVRSEGRLRACALAAAVVILALSSEEMPPSRESYLSRRVNDCI